MKYFYLFGTIIFTVLGQVILKWRVNKIKNIPIDTIEKIKFLINILLDPFVIIASFASFIAAFFWLDTLTKFELSVAYPFMSLSFVFVFGLSVIFLGESLNIYKIIGLFFILLGVILTAKGHSINDTF